MRWLLITWFLASDGLPTMPITLTPAATQVECNAKRAEAIKKPGQKAVCRQILAVLEVVK